jgi:ubiquinone/menaquinone biosynthesis C-methylase UbiE
MVVSALEGYRIWAGQYDEMPNPLLALEMRVLNERISSLRGLRFLDVGSGTGRWMSQARSSGASVFGIDVCREMILQSARKPGIAGRTVLADAAHIPFPDRAFDTAICSFALGYAPSIQPVLSELARVAERVIVSDLHPAALSLGWKRSFRAADEIYELAHTAYSESDLHSAAEQAGLSLVWREQASFDEPEREIFRRAGKEHAFANAKEVHAVLITAWARSSN